MNNSLFNSPFEMGLRIVLLLSQVGNRSITIDRIIGLDFVACYARDFDLSHKNLHGDNTYRYGEISGRRMLAQEAVKTLVLEGLITVSVEEGGYVYRISDRGERYAVEMKTEYSQQYREAAKAAIRKYIEITEESLLATIQNYSIRKMRG